MITDEQLREGLSAMLESVEAPTIPLESIHRRMHAPMHHDRRPLVIGAVGVAALVVACSTLPVTSPHVAQSVEQKIASVLHWSAPPSSPPPSVTQAMQPQTVSLEEARARVNFTLVPPAGLPSDVSGSTISVAPTGAYSDTTHTWSTGPVVVVFSYTRSNGRSFLVSAAAAPSNISPQSKYVFEDRGVDNSGNPILVQHERFSWRNGNQIMSITAGDGISAAEILATQTAMHGTPVPNVWPPPPSGADMMWGPKPQ